MTVVLAFNAVEVTISRRNLPPTATTPGFKLQFVKTSTSVAAVSTWALAGGAPADSRVSANSSAASVSMLIGSAFAARIPTPKVRRNGPEFWTVWVPDFFNIYTPRELSLMRQRRRCGSRPAGFPIMYFVLTQPTLSV